VREPEGPQPPGEMRASDQERDQTVKLLGEHAAVGRLTLDELEERVGMALVTGGCSDSAIRCTRWGGVARRGVAPVVGPNSHGGSRWGPVASSGSRIAG
jgi:hypothetical protein